MTHDELLANINKAMNDEGTPFTFMLLSHYGMLLALHAVVELHKPSSFESGPGEYETVCSHCQQGVVGDKYPCTTIQTIEKVLG